MPLFVTNIDWTSQNKPFEIFLKYFFKDYPSQKWINSNLTDSFELQSDGTWIEYHYGAYIARYNFFSRPGTTDVIIYDYSTSI